MNDWAFQSGLLARWLIAAVFVAAAYCLMMSVVVSRVAAPYTAEYLQYVKTVSAKTTTLPTGAAVEIAPFEGQVRKSRSAIAQPTTLASGIFAAFGLLLVVMHLRRPGGAG